MRLTAIGGLPDFNGSFIDVTDIAIGSGERDRDLIRPT